VDPLDDAVVLAGARLIDGSGAGLVATRAGPYRHRGSRPGNSARPAASPVGCARSRDGAVHPLSADTW